MKIPVRFFSIGLLTASTLLLIIYLVIGNPKANADNIPIEDLISTLEANGYRTITKDEFISYTVYLDEKKETVAEKNEQQKQEETKKDEKPKASSEDKNNDDKKVDAKEEDKKDAEKKKDKAEAKSKSYTLTIKEGYVSQDIAKILKEEGIIQDELEMLDYLEKNNYSSGIQIGKFKLKSTMTLKEIAEKITTYPGS